MRTICSLSSDKGGLFMDTRVALWTSGEITMSSRRFLLFYMPRISIGIVTASCARNHRHAARDPHTALPPYIIVIPTCAAMCAVSMCQQIRPAQTSLYRQNLYHHRGGGRDTGGAYCRQRCGSGFGRSCQPDAAARKLRLHRGKLSAFDHQHGEQGYLQYRLRQIFWQ